MTIGERIKYIRKKNGLTQVQLGEMTYISHGHISRVERGYEIPSKRFVKLVSIALNVNYEWLMYGKEKDENEETISLGEKMKSVRVEKCLTLNEVAEKMTVTESCVCRIENNLEKPTDMYIALFCYAFGISTEKLLEGIKNVDNGKRSCLPD